MHTYEVGKPFRTDGVPLPNGNEYNYRKGEHLLVLFIDDITDDEAAIFQYGDAYVSLAVVGPVIFLLYDFMHGKLALRGDAPFNIHLVHPSERSVPQTQTARGPSGSHQAQLSILLVDSVQNVIRGIRVLTLSEHFTEQLERAILEQSKSWADSEYTVDGISYVTRTAYDLALDAIYENHPTHDSLLERATVTYLSVSRSPEIEN